jgi:hypothetical protein
MIRVTDTHRRLIYAHLEGQQRSVLELSNLTGLTRIQVLAVIIDATTTGGWVRTAGPGCYRAVARPACCQGGYVPPQPQDRTPPHTLANALRRVVRS